MRHIYKSKKGVIVADHKINNASDLGYSYLGTEEEINKKIIIQRQKEDALMFDMLLDAEMQIMKHPDFMAGREDCNRGFDAKPNQPIEYYEGFRVAYETNAALDSITEVGHE